MGLQKSIIDENEKEDFEDVINVNLVGTFNVTKNVYHT